MYSGTFRLVDDSGSTIVDAYRGTEAEACAFAQQWINCNRDRHMFVEVLEVRAVGHVVFVTCLAPEPHST